MNNSTDTALLLDIILDEVRPVNLINTLVDKLEDNLLRYQKKVTDVNGSRIVAIDPLRVPQKLYMVAIVKELEIVIEKHNFGLLQKDGIFYIFNGLYWIHIDEESVKYFLSKATIALNYYSPADAMTDVFKKEIAKQFSTVMSKPKKNNNKSIILINLLNGTLEIDLQSITLRKHDKDDFFTYCLSFEYDKNAKAPLYQKYLNEVLPDESSQLILKEYHGYIFTNHLKLEKALILYGSGQNGKSVQYEITAALLGKQNVATKTLRDLTNNDSGNDNIAALHDKLVNYGSEIDSKHMNHDIFKRLVSGEPVSGRKKFHSSIDISNNCKFIFNANKLPENAEHTEAYFRRFLIIPYTVKISQEEIDPELHTKIIQNELPGILNWVIEGLERIAKLKKFSQCDASIEALNDYQKESNSIALMLEDQGYYTDNASDTSISNKDFYEIYTEYCKCFGLRAESMPTLSRELVKLGFQKYRKSNERGFYVSKKNDTNDNYDKIVEEH